MSGMETKIESLALFDGDIVDVEINIEAEGDATIEQVACSLPPMGENPIFNRLAVEQESTNILQEDMVDSTSNAKNKFVAPPKEAVPLQAVFEPDSSVAGDNEANEIDATLKKYFDDLIA